LLSYSLFPGISDASPPFAVHLGRPSRRHCRDGIAELAGPCTRASPAPCPRRSGAPGLRRQPRRRRARGRQTVLARLTLPHSALGPLPFAIEREQLLRPG